MIKKSNDIIIDNDNHDWYNQDICGEATGKWVLSEKISKDKNDDYYIE